MLDPCSDVALGLVLSEFVVHCSRLYSGLPGRSDLLEQIESFKRAETEILAEDKAWKDQRRRERPDPPPLDPVKPRRRARSLQSPVRSL